MNLKYLTPQTQKIINICRKLFKEFDEIWLIGHKGDHYTILSTLNILSSKNPITLSHVHSTLGIKAKYMLKPPEGSSVSVESVHTNLNSAVNKHVKRIMTNNKKVCILTPFSNTKLDETLEDNHAKNNFTVTSPTNNCNDFFNISNKLISSVLIENALSNNTATKDILIPWIKIESQNMSFGDFKKRLKLNVNQGIFIQIDISASGDGTELVKSQKELDILFKKKKWCSLALNQRLKASAEIKNAYPANGSACIIPIDKNSCIVLVDPLSHKPTGIKEFHGKTYSGVGNDWTVQWPIKIQEQYIASATLIGNELYKRFGYTGLFGPDYVVSKVKGKFQLKITEINPRWQGTTPYQTLNALISNRIPLELMHYIIKLDKNNIFIPKLLQTIHDPHKYNKLSSNSVGCFYLKIGSPVISKAVKNNMNGYFLFTNGQIKGPLHKVSDLDIVKSTNLNNSILIGIKAPKLGETVGGKNLTPIGYIYGKSSSPIFLSDFPNVSKTGNDLYKIVRSKIFE